MVKWGLFISRFRRRMWKDHSAVPQERLGGYSLSPGCGNGEYLQNVNQRDKKILNGTRMVHVVNVITP